MIVLGIHTSFNSVTHDPSACLIINGKIVFAAEEEKFIRIKTASTFLPLNSIRECLKKGNINIKKVNAVATDGITYKPLKKKIEKFLIHHFGYSPKITVFNHALVHSAGSFSSSGFKKSLVVSVDGSGDRISTLVSLASKFKNRVNYKILYKASFKKSLGNFYTVFTNFLGFKSVEGEYKFMGMAAYGEPIYDLSEIIYFDKKKGKIITNSNYKKLFDINHYTTINESSYSEKMIHRIFKIKRPLNKKFKQEHFNLAASVQHQFEKIYLDLIKFYQDKTNSEYLCLSGGCALNCLANKKLLKFNFKKIYVMPASSDRGLSLGAAMLFLNKINKKVFPPKNMFLGKEFSEKSILNLLKSNNIKYQKIENKYKDCAREIKKGKVIGWFQGRSEFGPRALGNRSILANPKIKNMKYLLNSKIKYRESFRPFAPAILESKLKKHFQTETDLSYMTFNIDVPLELSKLIPEAVHFDGTSRVQSVNKKNNSNFFQLLKNVENQINIGAVINTSFNLSGEPIVDSPSDALRTFFSSGIDILYIENFKILKKI